MNGRDRLSALLDPSNTTLNGIDYVEIASPDQTQLRVHFLTTVALIGTITDVRIDGGETIPTVAVAPIHDTNWSTDAAGRPVLALTTATAGDFSPYTLTLRGPPNLSIPLDPYFSSSTFSFKATCPSDFDCTQSPVSCPPLDGDVPPIDYLAKDFRSFRQALTDFSALRYPQWTERSEADFGMMFLEALCALADDLSYTQDRVAAEATLDTATQRRSIVRLARLVDYEPRPATSARVLLQINVETGPLPAGLVVSAQGADGTLIDFETGTGLADQSASVVSSAWNGIRDGIGGIQPYLWDDSQRCLPVGATEMWVTGHGLAFTKGQQLLIDTPGATPADPPNRQLVTLAEDGSEEADALFPTNGAPTQVTRIRWRVEDALLAEHDLTRTTLAGNLVPATQGRRCVERFTIGITASPIPGVPVAVVRTGPGNTQDKPVPEFLYTLRNGRLVWLGGDDPAVLPLPELVLTQLPVLPEATPAPWTWHRRLLDAEPSEPAFTIDSAAWRRVTGNTDGSVFFDYDGDDGDTLRFGDGVFGKIPIDLAVPDVASFEVVYRIGVGATGNVAADSITRVDPAGPFPDLSVTNPFAASGGSDPEPDEQVRRLAPQAFRARQFRAVRRVDYQDAAKTLPWVSRAGTAYRWTGSWLTVFTTADPKGTETLTPDQHLQLVELLNRYRLAGYESYVLAPFFTSLDLIVTVCARPEAFRGDVETAVLAALGTGPLPGGRTGFFHPDRFTFGTPLERSALQAAIQDAVGVAGVLSVRFRQRGTSGFADLPDTVQVAPDRLLRVDNDPSRPEAGSLRVVVEGGK